MEILDWEVIGMFLIKEKCKQTFVLFKKIIKNYFVVVSSPFLLKNKISNINLFEQQFYSQNGEDGILQAIFKKIGTTNTFCVEFGVEDGQECNTRYLTEKKGWDFLYMDCGDNLPSHIKNEKVTTENIQTLFKKYKVPRKFDLLSIDIDFNDYWVWKAITKYEPRVVVIEYNSSIPPTQSKVVKYDADAIWDETNYFGASLLAYIKLAKEKGYTLVGCDSTGVNAFFVKETEADGNFEKQSINSLYKPPKYGEKVRGKHIGHTPSKKKMMNI